MRFISALLAILVLAACLLLGGCSHLSVRHLIRRPWTLETVQTLDMKFWRFEYTASPGPDSFVIHGRAYPLEAVPPWVNWIQDLWFEAYLADTSGEVIAKDLRLYQPRDLERDKGVYFEFNLRPSKLGDPGQLFVTFGYRMKLSEKRPETPDAPLGRVFFASEGALTRL
jgi:hypothetical protein